MPKPTPEQNKNNVTVGSKWRDNKTGAEFIVNDIVSDDGIWKAKSVHTGTGIETSIRLDRLRSRKRVDARSGYTLVSGVKVGLPVPALGDV